VQSNDTLIATLPFSNPVLSLTTTSSTFNIATPSTTAAVSSPSFNYGSTTGITITATETGAAGPVTGGVVTFHVSGSATGTFSPGTCTLPAGDSCSTTYFPTGTLSPGTYVSGIVASFGAVGPYSATSAAGNITVSAGSTPPKITFPQPKPGMVGGKFALAATSSSGLPVTYSISSGSAFATLSGTNNSTVNYTGIGTVVINANYIWVLNSVGTLAEFDLAGEPSMSGGVNVSNATHTELAFDASGSIWYSTSAISSLLVSPTSGGTPSLYFGGGLDAPTAITIDGNGTAWLTNSSGTISQFTSARVPVSSIPIAASANISSPSSIQADSSGSLWISSSGNGMVVEVIGVASPVVTPTVNAVTNSTLGSKL